ncbi:MAG: radical SAM protein [Treponema sp.]|nr:radical SAM protein [Treponema sp.]
MMKNTGLIFNVQKFSIHDGPGIRTTVFFQGCPLRCKWCSNPESQEKYGKTAVLEGIQPAKAYSVDEIMAICLEDGPFYAESGGGVTLSGGEVLFQGEFAADLLARLGEKHIHRALETSGCADPALFKRLAALAELVLFDVKHHNRELHIKGTGVDTTVILENLRSLAALSAPAGPAVLPRIPVIPGYNDGPADAAAFAGLLASLGLKTVQLLPFHQFGRKKYDALGRVYEYSGSPILHPEDLEQYRGIFITHGIEAFF